MKQWKRCLGALLALVMLACVCPVGVSAATAGFENNHCLVFATEPGATSGHVTYYKDGYAQSKDAMTWVDGGVHGKALSLDGASEYLEIGFSQLRMAEMTFTTWINFRGSVDPANPAGAYWQRVFTIAASDNKCFFTASPHAVEPSYGAPDGGTLDGVFLEYYRGYTAGEGQEYAMRAFTGARAGQSDFGLPQNEWHHMAVVSDGTNVRLYIDGNLIVEELFVMTIVQMYANRMMIGEGVWDDPKLNALLDDTLLFDTALGAEQIAAVMQTGDPVSIVNSASITTTSTNYIPTTQTEAVASPNVTEVPEDKPYAPFGLPVWGFGVVMGLLAVIVVLGVICNLYVSNRRRLYGEETTAPAKEPVKDVTGEEEPPRMSIKEAAKKKRQEELDRFLAEEAAEQAKANEEQGEGSEHDET